MNAEVLCVGTELLIGQTVNTNATYFGQELAALGIDLLWISTVGDNFARLDAAIKLAVSRADLVLVTGGLGPTADDITIEAIARVLGEPLKERVTERERIVGYFEKINRPMADSNLKMALFPPSAELIPNPTGSASGMAVNIDKCQVMAFPGVPFEMKAMWEGWAKPRLTFETGATIRSALLKYVGIGEAQLAERVADKLTGVNPSVAPYAGMGEVHLRVTAKASSPEAADAMLEPVIAELSAIAPYYFGRDEETLASALGRLLKDAQQTMATAESCTSGLLASRMTDVPGATAYIKGGVVPYDSDYKAKLLGVPRETLDAGSVNQPVAEALAEGAKRMFDTDWGVGITGFAGPGVDVADEDVGLVWIAIAGPDGTTAERWRYGTKMPRETIKYRATQTAMDMLRRRLITSKGQSPE